MDTATGVAGDAAGNVLITGTFHSPLAAFGGGTFTNRGNADIFVANKADHAGEAKLVRELLDIASGRPILETIATQGKGVVELLDALFPG